MKKVLVTSFISVLIILLTNCSKTEKNQEINMKYAKDKHSFANPNEAVIKHLNLNIIADFDKKEISGKASYKIEHNNASKIIVDTKDLTIKNVTLGNNDEKTIFKLGNEIEFLGRALEINIKNNTEIVNIYYNTTTTSEAIQWLTPQQTSGKKEPFLFTQGEAILTRTWIPIQDSPGIKITYNARVETPKQLMAVMSAKNPQQKNEFGVYNFTMKQPISPYLIALAIGDLEYRKISNRTGVYAEPTMIEKAAFEFEDTEKMLIAAENLYGDYAWEQYDIIVLPPSFPFGGMENPRLTFATPTIIAGDKSLTSLVAHEMAHSWSGNLVTNATWDDFWLNEGFTVYFEYRIMEELYGKDYANMLALLGNQDLKNEINELPENETKLKLNLEGRNPDDGMTDIAYEKGAALLRLIENEVGRPSFDKFLTNYFSDFKFKTLTTEEFVGYLDEKLLQPNKIQLNINEWVYEAGLPSNKIEISSNKFKLVDAEINKFLKNSNPKELNTNSWSTHEWLHFIRNLDNSKITKNHLSVLDDEFNFTNSENAEIASVWFEKSIQNAYTDAFPKMHEFLTQVGRRKFLVPLYKALSQTESGKEMARGIYNGARKNYHSVSTNTIDELLK